MTALDQSANPGQSREPLVYIVAGEPSGDNLAGRMMAALRAQTGDGIRFAGVGGPAMTKQGVSSLFPIGDLSLMGIAEILPHLPKLIRRLRETAADIARQRPDLVVTIDSPGFTFRLARRIRGLGIPIVHYVAPQLWAWAPGRGHKLSSVIDHIMALLPFEPEFFAKYQIPCTYVGHPILESGAGQGDAEAFRKKHGIGLETTLISVLPGSRRTEVKRLLPIFREVFDRLRATDPAITAVVSTVDTVGDSVAAATKDWPCPTILVTDPAEKYDAFAASRVALSKSGTVTLELAMAGLPMIVCYRVSGLTAFLARRLIRVDTVTLVNLLAGRKVVPELLQEGCTPDRIIEALSRLIGDEKSRGDQLEGFGVALERLGTRSPLPSERAADFVLSAIRKERRIDDAARP